jgi:starch synthase
MNLRILLVSNQIRGIDGTGGLGDVPVGLSKVLRKREDIDIRLMMPGFEDPISGDDPTLTARFKSTNCVLSNLAVPYGTETKKVDVFQIDLPQHSSAPNIICYLLRCSDVFGTPNKNTAEKAVFFSRAIIEFLRACDSFRVDLVHCNDWHTGLVPVYLKTLYRNDQYLGRVATLFTIHNAGGDEYQGGFPREDAPTPSAEEILHLANLDRSLLEAGKTQSLHHNGKFNFSKGGFGFADLLSTVSRRYRQELLTSAFSGGLEGLFKERASAFSGIVNGIDTEEWNPRTDEFLNEYTYSLSQPLKTIQQRKRNIRQDLLKTWTVNNSGHAMHGEKPYEKIDPDKLLIGVVTRIDFQKAPLLLDAIRMITDDTSQRWTRIQIALLGNANDHYSRTNYEQPLLDIARAHPDKLVFFNGFDIPLSHILYAASEVFLVPSNFEPCGLTQLVAMRYGTTPIVRGVGGLVDTVINNDESPPHANGFMFKEQVSETQMVDHSEALRLFVDTLEHALNVYDDQARWAVLVRNGMSRDCSWDVPSLQYMKLYHEAVRRCVEATYFI